MRNAVFRIRLCKPDFARETAKLLRTWMTKSHAIVIVNMKRTSFCVVDCTVTHRRSFERGNYCHIYYSNPLLYDVHLTRVQYLSKQCVIEKSVEFNVFILDEK